MSNENENTNIADADAPNTEVLRKGFFYGLGGKDVRKDGAVVGALFRVMDGTGKTAKTVWEGSNVEFPYPMTDGAAKEAAADCSTKVAYLDENGIVQQRTLTGLAAAVTIALNGRRDENIRGKIRGGKLKGDDAIRKLCAATFGFGVEKQDVSVEGASIADIMSNDELSPEEKTALMMQLIASAGVTVK